MKKKLGIYVAGILLPILTWLFLPASVQAVVYNMFSPGGDLSGSWNTQTIVNSAVTTAKINNGAVDLTTKVTGTLPVANGGTNAVTANAALNNLLPSQAAHAGEFLTTDGTDTSWAASSGGVSETSGTFTATFVNACTTTPTVDFAWVKIGSIVTLTVTGSSGFSCTSDSTGFNTVGGTGLPAAIIPASSGITISVNDIVALNNGVSTTACLTVDNGGFIALSVFASNTCGGWTAANGKAWNIGTGRGVYNYSVL